jgi:20S proteasome subunit beta 7
MKRLASFGDYTIIGAGGDMSDWQHIQHILESQIISEFNSDDGHTLSPEHIHELLARIMYSRRSKSDPLWNSLVVGGFKNGKKSFELTIDF